MRRFIVVAVAVVSLAVSGAAWGADNDKEQFQGVWKIVSVEIDGQNLPMEALKGAQLVVKGECYSFTLGDTHLEFTFKLDPVKKPKEIDLTVTEGPEKGKTYYGIYKFEGDLYTICRATEPGKARPAQFETKPKTGYMIVVWQRTKQ
jgi:uncharacterized protein (TIGR03067 family)